jgi:hypothetical protein
MLKLFYHSNIHSQIDPTKSAVKQKICKVHMDFKEPVKSTQLIERVESFIVSSDPANGAKNLSADGSTFTVQLNNPIAIPQAATNCTLEVIQASIWYTTPNISAALGNNQFVVVYNDLYGPVVTTITIPDGLYSRSALNNLLQLEFVNEGLPADVIELAENSSTQQTVLIFNYVDYQVDFTGPNTCREILGFDSRLVPLAPTTIVGQSEPSDNIAVFNTLNSYLISSNLIGNGIPVNDSGRNIITRVPISAKPGSQINYSPYNPIRTSARNLIGKSMNQFDVWLTDQRGQKLDTFNEYYSAVLILRYWI